MINVNRTKDAIPRTQKQLFIVQGTPHRDKVHTEDIKCVQ